MSTSPALLFLRCSSRRLWLWGNLSPVAQACSDRSTGEQSTGSACPAALCTQKRKWTVGAVLSLPVALMASVSFSTLGAAG